MSYFLDFSKNSIRLVSSTSQQWSETMWGDEVIHNNWKCHIMTFTLMVSQRLKVDIMLYNRHLSTSFWYCHSSVPDVHLCPIDLPCVPLSPSPAHLFTSPNDPAVILSTTTPVPKSLITFPVYVPVSFPLVLGQIVQVPMFPSDFTSPRSSKKTMYTFWPERASSLIDE